MLARGLHDRPGDQVGEAQLLAGALEVLAPGVEHVHRERAEAGGGGDRAALVHEARERGGRAADRPQLGAGAARCAGAPLPSIAASTSSLVTRPRGPLPSTESMSMPSALAMRAAIGVALAAPLPAGAGAAAAGASGSAAGCTACGAPAPAAMRHSTLPDRDGRVRLDQDLGDRAGHRRGHLGVDLVGGDLHQRRRRPPRRRPPPPSTRAPCPRPRNRPSRGRRRPRARPPRPPERAARRRAERRRRPRSRSRPARRPRPRSSRARPRSGRACRPRGPAPRRRPCRWRSRPAAPRPPRGLPPASASRGPFLR